MPIKHFWIVRDGKMGMCRRGGMRHYSRQKYSRRTFMNTGRDLCLEFALYGGGTGEWMVCSSYCCMLLHMDPGHPTLHCKCHVPSSSLGNTIPHTHTLSCTSKLPLLWWHVITGPWKPSFVVTCISFKVRNFRVHNEWPLESVQMWFGLLVCAVFTSVGLEDSMW